MKIEDIKFECGENAFQKASIEQNEKTIDYELEWFHYGYAVHHPNSILDELVKSEFNTYEKCKSYNEKYYKQLWNAMQIIYVQFSELIYI